MFGAKRATWIATLRRFLETLVCDKAVADVMQYAVKIIFKSEKH